MKQLFILCLLTILMASCSRSGTCRPYSEAIKDGSIERKYTHLVINSDTLELDYVRDQIYKDTVPFCYGNIDLEQKDFELATESFLKGYDPEKVRAVLLFCEGKDICNGDVVSLDDAHYLYILHVDGKNNGLIDYVNIATGQNETHYVSDFYASVTIHHLMNKSGIKKHPSAVALYNSSFNRERLLKVNWTSKGKDMLWHEAHP